MGADTLLVPRADFSIEDPWAFPSACRPVRMRRATDGTAPRLATSFAAYYDSVFLTLLYSGADDHVVATHLQHDAPLYEEDVVEAFLAPATPTEYFELEVSPRGTVFDARIESPDGVRKTMRADRGWTCEGLFAAVRKVVESDGSMTVDTVMRVPFSSLNRNAPAEGEVWRANFFRIDRHPNRGDDFSAWQPTMRTPADFHVVGAFGTIRFT
jgi:hypothetical protein